MWKYFCFSAAKIRIYCLLTNFCRLFFYKPAVFQRDGVLFSAFCGETEYRVAVEQTACLARAGSDDRTVQNAGFPSQTDTEIAARAQAFDASLLPGCGIKSLSAFVFLTALLKQNRELWAQFENLGELVKIPIFGVSPKNLAQL